MSRVYFHSQSGEAELWGGERAWLSSLCDDVALGLLHLRHDYDRWREFVNATGYNAYLAMPANPSDIPRWRDSLGIAITHGDDDAFAWKGRRLSMFDIVLNTACQAGGDALKLAARIHGQCEIHCWCEGADRAWLARIIDEGLTSGVFRKNTGHGGTKQAWEDVAAFLRSGDDEPVVLSYSVCDSFPSRYEADWEPPEGADLRPSWWTPGEWEALTDDERDGYGSEGADELWGNLPNAERWDIAMAALRAKRGGLQLDPATWDGYSFGHELSAFDLRAADYADRLDRALGVVPEPAERTTP